MEAEIESRSGGRRALAEQREALSAAIAQARLDALAAAKEIEGIRQAIEALEARRADAGGHRAALGEQINALKDMNAAIAAQVGETEKAAATLREKAQGATKDIEELIARRARRNRPRCAADRARRTRSGSISVRRSRDWRKSRSLSRNRPTISPVACTRNMS